MRKTLDLSALPTVERDLEPEETMMPKLRRAFAKVRAWRLLGTNARAANDD